MTLQKEPAIMHTEPSENPGETADEVVSKRELRLRAMESLDTPYNTAGYVRDDDVTPVFEQRQPLTQDIFKLFKLLFSPRDNDTFFNALSKSNVPKDILYYSMKPDIKKSYKELVDDPTNYLYLQRFNPIFEYIYDRVDPDTGVTREVRGFVQENDYVASKSKLSSALHSTRYTWLSSCGVAHIQPTHRRLYMLNRVHPVFNKKKEAKAEIEAKLRDALKEDPDDKEYIEILKKKKELHTELVDMPLRNAEATALADILWLIREHRDDTDVIKRLTAQLCVAPYPIRDHAIDADKPDAIYWPNDERHPLHEPDTYIGDNERLEQIKKKTKDSFDNMTERSQKIVEQNDTPIDVDLDDIDMLNMDYPFIMEYFDYLQETDDWRWAALIEQLDDGAIDDPVTFIHWMNQTEHVNGYQTNDYELNTMHGGVAHPLHQYNVLAELPVKPTHENDYLPQVPYDDSGVEDDPWRYTSRHDVYVTPMATGYVHFILLVWTAMDRALRDTFVRETTGVDTSTYVYRLTRGEMIDIDKAVKKGSTDGDDAGDKAKPSRRNVRSGKGVAPRTKTRARKDSKAAQANDEKYSPAVDRRIRDMVKDERALKLLSKIEINEAGTKMRFDRFVYRFEAETVTNRSGEERTFEPGVYMSTPGNEINDVRVDNVYAEIMERQREIEYEAWETRSDRIKARKPFKQRKNPLAVESMKNIRRMSSIAKESLNEVKRVIGVKAAYETVQPDENDTLKEGDNDDE